jgi:lipid-A-disaccharide synthase
MALMLPFEEPIWRRAGVKATYVGHPALEPGCDHRDASRIRLSIPDRVTALGILPGSRPHEVRRLLPDMLGASQRIAKRIGQLQARVVLATSLDSATRSFALATSAKYGIRVFDADPMIGATQVLSAFDVVVCASGTASLEAALAHAPPVVAYRVGVATGLMARAALRSPHIALPNIVLGRRAFAELVQHEASADRMATAIQDSLDSRDRLHRSCDEVAARLRCEGVPSENVARLLSPWVGSCGA